MPEPSPFAPRRPQLTGPSRSNNRNTYSEDRRWDEEEDWSDASDAGGTTHPGDTPRRQTRRHGASSHLGGASYIPAVPGGQAVPYESPKHQNPFAPPPQFSYGNGYPPPPATGYFSPPPQSTPLAYPSGGSYFSPGGYGPGPSYPTSPRAPPPRRPPPGNYGPDPYPSPRSPYERPAFKQPEYEPYNPRSPLSPRHERRRDSMNKPQPDYRTLRQEKKEAEEKDRRAAARERAAKREKENKKKLKELQRRIKELELEKTSRREPPRERLDYAPRDLIEYLPMIEYLSARNAEDMQRRQLMPGRVMMLFRELLDRQADDRFMSQYQDRLPYAGLLRPRPSTRSSFGSSSRDGYDDDLRNQIQDIVKETLLSWQATDEEEPERAGLPEAGRAMSEDAPSYDGYQHARDYPDEEPPYSPNSSGTVGRDEPFSYSESGRRGQPRRSTSGTPQPERRPPPDRKPRGPNVRIVIPGPPGPGKRPRSDTTSEYSAASTRDFNVPLDPRPDPRLESRLASRLEPRKTATRRPLGEGSSQTASRTAASTVAPGIPRRKSHSGGKRPEWVDPGIKGVDLEDELEFASDGGIVDYEDRAQKAPYSMAGGKIRDSRLNPREDLLPAVPEVPIAGSSTRTPGGSRRVGTPRSVTIEDVEEDLRYMESSKSRDRYASRSQPGENYWSDSDRA
ncbi:hypothetical protein OQA88_11340 [Cercophora sp. LCS_1]